jgi:hypothetical protein
MGEYKMAVVRTQAVEEVLEFLTSSPTPEQIIAFRPSEMTQERVRYLLEQNKANLLSEDEQIELNEFSQVEHWMRMLKARSNLKLVKP